jgi:hypothetical protein
MNICRALATNSPPIHVLPGVEMLRDLVEGPLVQLRGHDAHAEGEVRLEAG